MSSANFNSIANALSTGVIIAIVIGSVCGLALCIAAIIIVVCIIKHCNRSRHPSTRGMVLQQPYPSDMTSVANYPSLPPPYTAATSDYAKPTYTGRS